MKLLMNVCLKTFETASGHIRNPQKKNNYSKDLF